MSPYSSDKSCIQQDRKLSPLAQKMVETAYLHYRALHPFIAAPSAPPPDPRPAIIELIFAANAMASYLTVIGEDGLECVCGAITTPASVAAHHDLCPVTRFHAAVEAVRQAAL